MNREVNIYCDTKELWRTKFGIILRALFDIYGVCDENFSEYSESVLNYAITDSAVRKWFVGQRLPHQRSLQIIFSFFNSLNEKQKDSNKEDRVYAVVENYFSNQYLGERPESFSQHCQKIVLYLPRHIPRG